jgi:threonine/homoserine/homoserine lactone efflux protein
MFLKGLILGFSVAAPVGPIGLLCIQRTLGRGRLHGFISGLGAATADTLYGLVAALGLTAVATALLGLQFLLQLGGGLFLLGLGLKTALTPPAPGATASPADRAGLAGAYVSILLLTLANPATILSFVAVFAGLGIAAQSRSAGAACALVAGVFLGSAAWWLLLSFITGLLRHRLGAGGMRIVNLLAGCCIIALGLWSLVPVIRERL